VTTPYNDFFSTVEEARVAWGLYCIARDGIDAYMDKPLPPFPGDSLPRVKGNHSGFFGAVKAAVPVEELAGRFTNLRRSGPNTLKGRCPLHEERTPSFVIYQDKGYWRCFGACARGGDVINLAQALMDKGRLP
jgi:hypothetical protein